MNRHKICVIKGDGIGPEVVQSALNVLDNVNVNFEFTEAEVGYECFKKTGFSILEETIEICRETDATLFGSTTTPPNIEDFKSAIITLRQGLDLYANLRPVRSYPVSTRNGIDLIIVRENTEGLYSGVESMENGKAITQRIITKKGSERIIRFAFELAKKQNRRKVTVVHKANVLRLTDGLFLRTAFEIAKDYPDIEMDDVIVDAMAMRLIKHPETFDVIVTTNMFGDILSDEASQLIGGLGLAPSANIGDRNAIFEPAHGSAPKYTGQNKVNPIATIMSARMMLEWLGENEEAKRVENAVFDVLENKENLTYDMGGNASTTQLTESIIKRLV